MRIRLLSRSSDLAVVQARLVARALEARWPGLEVQLTAKAAAGDRDRGIALWEATEKGLFTKDLSEALAAGATDAVVHSWKDLPVEPLPGTRIGATLDRADPRDVLLIRRDVVDAGPPALKILTSSPRRAWQAQTALAPLLPWPVASVETTPVRGNIPTRVAKLVAGEGHALFVAKAALDRLLSDDAPSQTRAALRAALETCRWMVLPIASFPSAPAQGAIAVEVAAIDSEAARLVAAIDHAETRRAVEFERAVLAEAGGGCHEALGVTLRPRAYGDVLSVRGHLPSGETRATWTLRHDKPAPPITALAKVWPRPDERARDARQPVAHAVLPIDAGGLWVARAEAWPAGARASASQIVWAAGLRTWEKLARRGDWVHGCAEGLGDDERPDVDRLAGARPSWARLTHTESEAPGAVGTYRVRTSLPDDLERRTHFFWTSGRAFRHALAAHPAIGSAWHASGPGRTARTIEEVLGPAPYARVWLDYEQWLTTIIR